MHSELLEEAAVMFVDPDWIICSHDVLKVNEIVYISVMTVRHV